MSTPADEGLVDRFRRSGDREALSTLVARYDRPIYAFLVRLLREPQRAEEGAQEVFLRLLRGLDGYRSDSPFRPWIYRIALNVARTQSARESEQVRRERLAARADEDRRLDPADQAQRREIESIVGELPGSQKEAIFLHYYQGLSHSEVATALGIPPGTAATRIHGGLEALRDRLAVLGIAGTAAALPSLLSCGTAEAAPSSILAAVAGELAQSSRGPALGVPILKGVLLSPAKLSSVAALCLLLGITLVAISAHSSLVRPEEGRAVESRAEATTLPAGRVAAAPTELRSSAPAPLVLPPRQKTKVQKAGALMARLLKASANDPQGRGRATLSPEDFGEMIALASDPDLASLVEKAPDLDWDASREFFTALFQELVPDLTELQDKRFQEALSDILARTKASAGNAESAMERSLLRVRQGRELFQRIGEILTSDQGRGLSPLEQFSVQVVPTKVLNPGNPDEVVSDVLDLWSKSLAPLTGDDRQRLAAAAGAYAARLKAAQDSLEARYGKPLLASLLHPPRVRLAASVGAATPPASADGKESDPIAPKGDGRIAQHLEAVAQLLELEKAQRESLLTLLPWAAQEIREAEPYIPILEPGSRPGFLGVSGSDAPGGGVALSQVVERSPAGAAGLQSGDIITRIDGEPILDYATLFGKVRTAGRGTDLTLTFRRNGQELVRSVRLGDAPR